MRKMGLFIGALIISVLMLSVISIFRANAETTECYSIVTNPGEYSDTEMNIMWHTDMGVTGTYMLLTKKTDTAWAEAVKVFPETEKVTAFLGVSTIDASGTSYEQNTPFMKCVCALKDLDPDTEYMYKVGNNTMSAVHYFKTGGATEYSAAIVSDYHSYIKSPNRLKNGMAMIDTIEEYDKSLDLILDIGDTCAWGGSYNFWRIMYEQQNFHDYLWAGTNGNHDNMDKTDKKNTYKFFASTHANPKNGPEGQVGTVYYFIYCDTLFLVFNNEDMNANNVAEYQAWAQNAIDNNPTKYIIIMEHYQWFNVLSGSTTHYDRWKEFCDKNGVDLAISGNHHIYCRSGVVKDDHIAADGIGTMYLETSSSDNERGQGTWVTGDINELSTASAKEKEIIQYYYTEGGNTVSGVLMNVDQTGIKVTLLDRNGKKLDEGFVKAKRESPALSEDQKNNLKNETEFYQNETGTSVLALPETLTGYAASYEIYNGTELITSGNYRNKASRFVTLDLAKGTSADLSVKVKFKDSSETSYAFHVDAKQNCNIINTLKALGKKLVWNINDSDNVVKEYKVYCNDKELGTSTKGEYDIATVKYGDTYKVEAIANNGKVLETLTTVSGIFGDVNCDGEVNDADIKEIQKYINGEVEISEEVLKFADVNNDNKVNIQDAAYIKLAKAGLITSYCCVQYTVNYYGANGEKVETIKVKAGSDATPTFTEKYEYKVVTYLTDYHNITGDTEIYAIYAKENK